MEENFVKNASVHICARTHMNIVFNIYQCGNYDVNPGCSFATGEEDVFIIFYVNQGVCYLESKPFTAKIGAGRAFVIFPEVKYRLKSAGTEALNLTWVAFSGYRVDDYLARAAVWSARPVVEDPKGALGEKLNHLYMLSHEPCNRYCKMASVLYDIFAYLRDEREKNRPEGYKENLNYFAACAVNYIEHNYMNEISVNEIADTLGISRKHLGTVFHKILGVTPRQYIIYYRIQKAGKLLDGTNQSIQEIAEAVGYANQFYFAKEFKRVIGKSPSEYRREGGNCQVCSWYSFASSLIKQYDFGNPDEESDWNVVITPPGRGN